MARYLRVSITVTGTVQGVGFRPFVLRLARQLGLDGEVGNHGGAVWCEAEGERAAIDQFVAMLTSDAPPLAEVRNVTVREIDRTGSVGFSIADSAEQPGLAGIPPDIATCDLCWSEFTDPNNRRFNYPFICCTDCGPRYTVVSSLPYDRANTSLVDFDLCSQCQEEYNDPNDRRFHAQAICCADCGPTLTALSIPAAVQRLLNGDILAVKGLGGFQLMCRGDQSSIVQRLRQRKHRDEKPFALLVPSLGEAEALIELDAIGRKALSGPEAPIVLASATSGGRRGDFVAPEVAPGSRVLGVMLPSTPLHAMLARGAGVPLVCTSGNRSNEPIVIDDAAAATVFDELADGFVTHNRRIERRADDSVGQVVAGRFQLLRRARGFAPRSISLPIGAEASTGSAPGSAHQTGAVLGVGAELKNTVCLSVGDQATVSVHLGDLENLQTFRSFELAIADQLAIARVEPELVVHDLHPEYLSTKFAVGQELAPTLAVQHHHAHLVSCLIDNGHSGPAIGATFDGIGWGTDNTAWGGEFLVGDANGYNRAAHLAPVALPGGGAAITSPWRMAIAHLVAAFDEVPEVPMFAHHDKQLDAVVQLCADHSTITTSSIGRVFDAVAALCGFDDTTSYEGQAAIGLEQLAVSRRKADVAGEVSSYSWTIAGDNGLNPLILSPSDVVSEIYADIVGGADRAMVALKFHHSVADVVVAVCGRLGDRTGLDTVALTGGVFQNRLLVELVVPRLAVAGFQVLRHRQVPPNDGGISLGQVAIGKAHLAAKPT